MSHISPDGRAFDSLDDMLADYRRNLTTWDRVSSWCRCHLRNPVRDSRRVARWAYQRVVRGWDDLSVWSIKASLSRTLGAQLVEMANISHGFPPDYPNQPIKGGPQVLAIAAATSDVHERWMSDLRKNGEALLAYAADDEDLATYESAQAALRWVADNLADLWD